ncbi:hypothetical protein P152DRAFT_396545 [Eremomyces bilateralis CBS 781.70]|uniref:F-box domain-containing protein n=1 Tax=Eremomyces bilateralis CBS 781.70 TaxID=1392243 RepID=A0A6G1G499_9PEZI|nr:uncharacterized protein P152DRAFT_396545 [Eremomyces bilateralis CBS 781.70]KAF1812894.1 hypothetical protein P152DRAFT_396545 [Eremomyces bilateralis CBS 781.70]
MGIFEQVHEPCKPTLTTILSNPLLLHLISPYIPLPSLIALSATCHDLHGLFDASPVPYRRLELSPLRHAYPPPPRPLAIGGTEQRTQQMDDSLTASDFYSAPLRGIFAQLSRRHMLNHISTMVLDGLAVTAELVREIICEDRFNVRVLSIREVKHLNELALRQTLLYAARPGRADGALKLRALYVFGGRDPLEEAEDSGRGARTRRARTRSPLPATGRPAPRSPHLEGQEKVKEKPMKSWYHPSGRILPRRPDVDWATVLHACEGLIYFDAVLCRGPRHNPCHSLLSSPPSYLPAAPTPPATLTYLPPAIATIALGHGCTSCTSCPESPAIYGSSPSPQLPLLAPPPLHASTVRAAQCPLGMLERWNATETGYESAWPPRVYARCEACLKQRWCERCGKWWCEECYDPGRGGGVHGGGEEAEHVGVHDQGGQVEENEVTMDEEHTQPMGSKRECFGCGQTCHSCTKQFIRPCRTCRNEYCVLDNDGSSATDCDWCRYSGRRTLDPY